jgi:hypothetical protein
VANVNEKLILSQASPFGPQLPQIGLITFLTDEILDFGNYAIAVNLAYAIHQRYIFRIFDKNEVQKFPDIYDVYDMRWNKVKLVQSAMNPNKMSSNDSFSWGKNLDYIMWLDSDYIFINHALQLHIVIGMDPAAHFIVSAGQ